MHDEKSTFLLISSVFDRFHGRGQNTQQLSLVFSLAESKLPYYIKTFFLDRQIQL